MYAVELTSVTKSFGAVTAVDDLSLAVPEGAIYGFIGPNGSGKTTTMRMIVNIFYPDSGSVRVFGQERKGALSEHIGYLPEERGLYRKMGVRELLEFYGELRGGTNVGAAVTRWLEKLQLADCATRRVEALSKGMSQKVQFIAAVVPEPRLLILDEPFSGLDPVSAGQIREEVIELRRRGVTVILSTHDMHVAETLCDSIFMIFRGRKVLDGPLTSIQDQYGNDTIRVTLAGDAGPLQDLPGVEAVRDFGQMQELRMSHACDPQQVLRELVARASVTSFSITRPSLNDIFLRIAGNAQEEVHHA
ncbi:MAG: ATP-binding cassette domain-containing protein [Acidobacteria bacterium]|nr:ATP-binding cassette domain-containing protein [Acidobacteriota bacterium]